MSSPARPTFLALILIVSSATATSQNNGDWRKMSKPSNNQSKVKTEKIAMRYDRFKDRTTVQTDYMGVFGSDWNSNPLKMSVLFSYQGQKPAAPSYVALYFWSNTRDWRFLDPPIVRAIADGQRLTLGQSQRTDSDIHASRYSVSVSEEIAVIVSLDTFLRLIDTQSIEMQVGPIEFSLKDKHLATLRALTGYMR